MLIVEKVDIAKKVEFCGFLDEEGAFNLVSDVNDDEGFNLSEGVTGYIRISSDGYLQEIEMLNVKPVSTLGVQLDTPKDIIQGVPIFNPSHFVSSKHDPVLVIDGQIAYILLSDEKISEIDAVVVCETAKFFLKANNLVAIRVTEIIKDVGGREQSKWLEERNLI